MKLILLIITCQLRVVSLAPSVSEIIFKIGGGELLVGVTDYCSYPPEGCRMKEKVGGVIDPSLEKIIYLSPDIVIGFKGLTPPWVISSLKSFKFRVEEVRTLSLSDLKRDVLFIGSLLNLSSNAQEVVKEIDSIESCQGNKKWNVVVLVNLLPPIAAGGRAFINEILKRTGLKNAFSDVDADYFTTSYEEIVLRNPDFALLIGKGEKTFVFYGIRFYTVDENLYSVPSPRVSYAVRDLCVKVREWERESP